MAIKIELEKTDRKKLKRLVDDNNHQGIVIVVETPAERSKNKVKQVLKHCQQRPCFWSWIMSRNYIFSVPVRLFKDLGVWVMSVTEKTTKTAYQTDFIMPFANMIGAEGKSLSRLTKEQFDLLVKLSMLGQVESLHLSVAADVLHYETVRQRQQ